MTALPDELLEGAVFERRGSFTLAADKAREKMRRFQLENPRRYLLQVVAALVASGAGAIDVTTDESDLLSYTLQVEFDGPGYTAADLQGLYDAVFLPGDEPATDRLRELALGVLGAQGIPATRLEIRSGGALWLWEGGETTLQPEGAPPGHRIALAGPGDAEEARLLRDNCQAVPLPLRLNGELVNTPTRRWSAAVPWPAKPFRLADAEGVVGLPYRDLDASRLAFYRHGVQFASRKLPELRPPVSIAVQAPRLRKNISQTDVVEDEAWRDLTAALPGVVIDLATLMATREAPAYHREEVGSFLLSAIVEWLPPEIVAQPVESWPAELRPLAKARLFADRKGHRVSLDDLRAQATEEGSVYVTSRRLPYAPLGDWLLLNPGKAERAVLERYFRLVDVDGALPDLLRQGGGRPRVEPPALSDRPLAHVRREGVLLAVDDRAPDGRCRVRWTGARWTAGDPVSYREFPVQGLAVDVTMSSEKDPDAVLRRATAALQDGVEPLFGLLLAALATETGLRRARAREHLLSWWRSRLDPALGGVAPADPAERAALCRRALGDEAWTAPVFDTRSGTAVSLHDVAAWLARGGTLAVAIGGPRRPGDQALDGSPAQLAFLSQVFGAEAIVRATLQAVVQEGLAPPAVTPDSPAASTAETAAEAESTADPEAESWRAWREALPQRPALASHAFQEGPLSGYLAVTAEADEMVALRGDSVQPLGRLFGRSVVGWIQAPVVEADGWTAEEEVLLRGQVDLLYDRLAEAMGHLDPASPEFAGGRARLVEHLLASPSRVRDRLEADSPQDPLLRLRFLPLVGDGLASLADLWPEVERLGYLPVGRERRPEAAGARPVALVGARIPETFYERLFLKTGPMEEAQAETLPYRLLQAAMRELRQARTRGDYRLTEAVLDRIEWTDFGAEPVLHDPRTGRTLVNRAHRSLRRLTARFAKDPDAAGLLASAIFSAVNRALEDVGDEDEVRFLEALLDVASA